MLKSFTVLLLIALCTSAFAFEHAKIRIKKLDGSIAEKNALFEKQNGGYYRITIPVANIKRDVEYIDIIADEAIAKKSEEGFFVLGDGSYGEFTQENGSFIPPRSHMPIFGMKTPRGSLCNRQCQ